ncbi:hypothetical protein [Hymenobacter jeollabukensis]|uniref:DUF4384 domain-containing protein n=1 Tax=Hymenobacter jeollabukensis TaxID=2025313 RepID=A0A5R8WJ48_9BACT|nr:hypothetical protein [Hymenobacter jeollabukensis]TLM88917.1 hypothetical protein FDY95_22300 [Hymenobacter jeollabukensis]
MLTLLKRPLLLAGLGLSFALAGCPSEGTVEPVQPRYEPGFGPSKEHPVGTPFTWPAGITLIGEPADDNRDCVQDALDQRHFLGVGGMVSVCLNLYNSTSQPINVVFPPGLVVVSQSERAQNGFVATRTSFEVPPGQHFFRLHTNCANGGTRQPSGGYRYEAQLLVTQHPGMQELLNLLAAKKINFEEYGGQDSPVAAAAAGPVGSAVGQVAFDKEISEQVRRELAALPPR